MAKVSNPLISVVVPVYNVEQYLRRCVDSILSQTYKNIEVILVDDGSTDNSGKICDKYAKNDKRIKVQHKDNGGLSSARNAGIKTMNGEYVSFVDSDDWIEPNYLEVLHENLKKNHCDISMVKHFIDYPMKSINASSGRRVKLDPHNCLNMMLYSEDVDVSAWAKLYPTNIFNKIRFPEGRLFEDSATTYKLIDCVRNIFLDSTPLYHYTIRDDSITNKNFSMKDLDIIKSTKEMTNYIVKKYPDLEKGCTRRLMYSHLSAFRKYAISKNHKKYESEARKIFKYIKTNRKTVLSDKRIPKRDRVALRLAVGFCVFVIANKLYEYSRGVL